MTRERDAPTLHPKVGGLGPQRRQKPQDSSGNGGLACHSGNGDGGQKEWGSPWSHMLEGPSALSRGYSD